MPKKSPEQLYEESERALIGEAIAETEQEIFDDALDRDPDDNDGDTSLEEIDGEDILDNDESGEEEGEEGDGEDEAEGEEEGEETPPETRHQPEDRGQRGIPSSRLREEADRRQAAETENRELRSRIEALERGQRQQPQPRQDQPGRPEPPDLFADPDGRLNYERAQLAREFNERRINTSFDDAREEAGDERFVTAFQALQGSNSPALVNEILNANNPGKALMRWHERQSLLSEIGNDPAAYRQRLREELLADPETRRAVISGARNDAMRGDGGRPRTQTRLPPSLNSATGGTSHRGNSRDTARTNRSIEQEIFESAFED